jgi:ariadne-1
MLCLALLSLDILVSPPPLHAQTSGMVISGEDEKLPIVNCECNNKWCFECAEEPHSPLTCSLVRTWNSTADDNDRTQLLIKASCKKCPKCATVISQDQGCLHMTCPKCKCHFCWLCLATPFHSQAVGGYYKCQKYENRVKDAGLNAEEKAQAIAKLRLEKYTDSYQRFVHHKAGKDGASQVQWVQ